MGKILNQVEDEFKEHKVESNKILILFRAYWEYVAALISNFDSPIIYVPKFGWFIPFPSRIEKKLKRFKNNPSKTYTVEVQKQMEKSVKRLRFENQKRKRKNGRKTKSDGQE